MMQGSGGKREREREGRAGKSKKEREQRKSIQGLSLDGGESEFEESRKEEKDSCSDQTADIKCKVVRFHREVFQKDRAGLVQVGPCVTRVEEENTVAELVNHERLPCKVEERGVGNLLHLIVILGTTPATKEETSEQHCVDKIRCCEHAGSGGVLGECGEEEASFRGHDVHQDCDHEEVAETKRV